MLSYQHAYHAGGVADVHKHSALCLLLCELVKSRMPIDYLESHGGRGRYDLGSMEARKTQEARLGIYKISETDIPKLAKSYTDFLKRYNKNIPAPRSWRYYAGSPLLAAHCLRPSDRIFLHELHPQEFNALQIATEADQRIFVKQQDGYAATIGHKSPLGRRMVLLCDPSFEVKAEYEQTAGFIADFVQRRRDAVILLWYPLLPKGYETAFNVLKALDGVWHDEVRFCENGAVRGLYGSGLMGVNVPENVKLKLKELGAWVQKTLKYTEKDLQDLSESVKRPVRSRETKRKDSK